MRLPRCLRVSTCSLVRTVQQTEITRTCYFLVMKVNIIVRPLVALIIILGSIRQQRQKYFHIRGKEGEFLSGGEENTTVVASAPGDVSCRWSLTSLGKLFHWRGDFLVNGWGHSLGVEASPLCGPGFEVLEAETGGDGNR